MAIVTSEEVHNIKNRVSTLEKTIKGHEIALHRLLDDRARTDRSINGMTKELAVFKEILDEVKGDLNEQDRTLRKMSKTFGQGFGLMGRMFSNDD